MKKYFIILGLFVVTVIVVSVVITKTKNDTTTSSPTITTLAPKKSGSSSLISDNIETKQSYALSFDTVTTTSPPLTTITTPVSSTETQITEVTTTSPPIALETTTTTTPTPSSIIKSQETTLQPVSFMTALSQTTTTQPPTTPTTQSPVPQTDVLPPFLSIPDEETGTIIELEKVNFIIDNPSFLPFNYEPNKNTIEFVIDTANKLIPKYYLFTFNLAPSLPFKVDKDYILQTIISPSFLTSRISDDNMSWNFQQNQLYFDTKLQSPIVALPTKDGITIEIVKTNSLNLNINYFFKFCILKTFTFKKETNDIIQQCFLGNLILFRNFDANSNQWSSWKEFYQTKIPKQKTFDYSIQSTNFDQKIENMLFVSAEDVQLSFKSNKLVVLYTYNIKMPENEGIYSSNHNYLIQHAYFGETIFTRYSLGLLQWTEWYEIKSEPLNMYILKN